MADNDQTTPREISKTGDSGDKTEAKDNESKPDVIPPEAEEVVKKLISQGDPKALFSFFAAAARTTVGPDPETAKVLAEVEKHSEESRLEGYRATLENRNKQSERDHEFRKKRLNHTTFIKLVVLVLLCYKHPEPQKGQQGSCRSR